MHSNLQGGAGAAVKAAVAGGPFGRAERAVAVVGRPAGLFVFSSAVVVCCIPLLPLETPTGRQACCVAHYVLLHL